MRFPPKTKQVTKLFADALALRNMLKQFNLVGLRQQNEIIERRNHSRPNVWTRQPSCPLASSFIFLKV